ARAGGDGKGADGGLAEGGGSGEAGASLPQGAGAWLYCEPEGRFGGVSPAGSGGAADRCRSGLAILPSCSARVDDPPRTNSDGGQLERPMAGTGGHVELERFAHQGGGDVFDAVDRRFYRRFFPPRPAAMASHGTGDA